MAKVCDEIDRLTDKTKEERCLHELQISLSLIKRLRMILNEAFCVSLS